MNNEKKNYNMSYFLSSLGNGGLAVSVFIYLMFMVKHPNTPMPTFEDITKAFSSGSLVIKGLLIIALIAILYFAFRHYYLLAWNMNKYNTFKKSEDYKKLRYSNNEVSLLILPLTLAMSVNVLLITATIFVPKLWGYVEYLLPLSSLVFFSIGVYGVILYLRFLSRIMINGSLEFESNNNFNQLIPSFTFAMIGVGLAAAGAMSHNIVTSSLGVTTSILFNAFAFVILIINSVLSFSSIVKIGIDKATAASVWISLPIMALFGISVVRITSGISHNLLHKDPSAILIMVFLSILVSIQAIVGLIGYTVLKNKKYFKQYTIGKEKNPGTFSLICPGVAFFVLGMFFIHWGLVKTGILTIFTWQYYLTLTPFILVQFKTVRVLGKLSKRLIKDDEIVINIEETVNS